jgi:hypothetical protein
MPEKQDGLESLATFIPEHTLEFYKTERSANGNKRNYIADYGKSRSCEHTNLRVTARGGISYRCLDCNYVFTFPGAHQEPMHHRVILGLLEAFHFSKEFGMDALGEVLRTPIGQSDGTAHKPVLPEGMSFVDALKALEEVDATTPDHGAQQLYEMVDEVWVDAQSRARRLKELGGMDAHRRPELNEGIQDNYDPDMPSLPEAGFESLPSGNSGVS